jgi:hypothetical protein
MKRSLLSTLFVLMITLFGSCSKDENTIRFKNEYNLTIDNVQIGNAFFGSVSPGSITGYQSIEPGNFQISGKASNGAPLTGSGSISGKGTHKWTVTLRSSGSVGISED